MTNETLSVGRLSASGKRAARTIFDHGPRKARYTEHFDVTYAKAALDELAHLVDTKTPGLYADQRDGIDAAVEDLHVRPERALAEIAQNADDCQATALRLMLRDGPTGRQLLCTHDGTRVTLRDAVGMTFAYISGKREHARSTGKFGIGLKTIAGMAGSFEVHSRPYHFSVERQHPVWTEPQPDIPGFWEASSGETLLVLHLHRGYDESGAVDWLRDWGTSSMLFLDTLRKIAFRDQRGGLLAELAVEVEALPQLWLGGLSSPVDVRLIIDAGDASEAWTTYMTDVIAPPGLSRAHKKRDRTTPVGIAIPRRDTPTQIFAGLPLDEESDLPFSVHGQFDPDPSRAQVRKTDWNEFVIASSGELACAVLLHLFATDPASAWPAVPLGERGAGRDGWTAKQFERLVNTTRRVVAAQAMLPGCDHPVALSGVIYEAAPLERLVGSSDLAKLDDAGVPLIATHRDPAGSWRIVLDDLDCGHEVDPPAAAAMFDWDHEQLGCRSPAWFAGLVEAVLDAGAVSAPPMLERRRCLLLADGTRLAPAVARSRGALLTREDAGSTLANTLGTAMHADSAFVDACDASTLAGPWLRKTIGLRDKPGAGEALESLAGRIPSDPLELSNDTLVALRDALTKVPATKLEDLASRIGERIRIRGYETMRGGKRREVMVKPAESYLPATIDGQGADGFPQAAKRIPGLHWIHPSYADLLKTPRGSRKLPSRPLFLALGAHASPRIQPVNEDSWLHDGSATRLPRLRPATQDLELTKRNRPGERINGIRDDHDSNDLIAILEHITKLRGVARQRAARALVLSIEREWPKRYADVASARAMYGHGYWYDRGPIPATWLARVQSTRFLTSESSRVHAPTELVLRSDAYVAIMGEDRSSFCKEFRQGDIDSEVAELIGFAARPKATRIVAQLSALRSRAAAAPSAADPAERTGVAYLALAAYCREARAASTRASGRDQIDDVTAEELRAAFAQGVGLIFAAGNWFKPNEVFRGAPIFGERRPFVSADARELWDVLRVTEPSVGDCVEVLKELVDEPGAPSQQTLTDIYKRIDVEILNGRRLRELKKLPLWTGSEWRTSRPVYTVAQEGLARSLGLHLPVWHAPCAVSALSRFVDASGMSLLHEHKFEPQGITPGHRGAGAKTRPQFLAALRDFADLLSKQHPTVHSTARVSFDELESYDLAHSAKLEVLVPLTSNDTRAAPVEVFASSTHRLIAFRDPEALGRLEIGGMAIGALFGEQWTMVLAPLWEVAWTRADPDNLREKVRLAREQPTQGDPLKQLLETAAAHRATKALVRGASVLGNASHQPEPNTGAAAPRPPKTQPRRRLRDLSHVTFGEPELTGKEEPAAHKRRRQRRLKEPPKAASVSAAATEPRGIREFGEKDKETAGFNLLARALKSLDGGELEDYRELRNIGSDAVDNLKRYFELKAHEGDIPNEISLTGPEIERALKARGNYFLAVVGGLETGEVVVKIFADPLASLDFIESGSITLSGIHTKRSLLLSPRPSADGASIGPPIAD
jgi:hypothetical protein